MSESEMVVQVQAAHTLTVTAYNMSDSPGRVTIILDGNVEPLLPELTNLVVRAVREMEEDQ